MGWTNLAAVALKEKEPFAEQRLEGFYQGLWSVDGFSRGSSVYMPASARLEVVAPVSTQAHPTAGKVAVLRGDDFPSLRATLSSTSGPAQKHKENLNQSQEQKHFAGENVSSELKDASHLGSIVDMRSRFHPSNSGADIGNGTCNLVGSQEADQTRKQEEYLSDPLPLFRLNLRSDWADDECDTSHCLTERRRRIRDNGYSKKEAFRDRDCGMPGLNILPQNVKVHYVGSEQHNRNKADSVQSSVSKSSFSLGGKWHPVSDPLLNSAREKHPLLEREKAPLEYPFTKDFGASGFDGRNLFSAGLIGVVKKKKDVLNETDFHDSVRESFEAELETVQRMQEQEQLRIVDEQEMILELARIEEEERLRQGREHEEMQRRLEEKAREAAWRAEQERIEA